MLNIHDDRLVVDHKGIYSIEKFLVARRLMYWQVYLHKTSVAAERMLMNILKRAKMVAKEDETLFGSPALRYFLYKNIDRNTFLNSDDALENFALLDDSDLVCAIKVWMNHPDIVLSTLCRDFTNRRLFKVLVGNESLTAEEIKEYTQKIQHHFNISESDAKFFVGDETVSTDTYSSIDDSINILLKDGTVKDITDVSDMLNLEVLTKKVAKHFFCYYNI